MREQRVVCLYGDNSADEKGCDKAASGDRLNGRSRGIKVRSVPDSDSERYVANELLHRDGRADSRTVQRTSADKAFKDSVLRVGQTPRINALELPILCLPLYIPIDRTSNPFDWLSSLYKVLSCASFFSPVCQPPNRSGIGRSFALYLTAINRSHFL